MTKNNRFPGTNPFLERHWSDVRTKLITYIADAIAERLPPELNARSEGRVTLHDAEGKESDLRADVAVVESWKQGIPPQWQPEDTVAGGVVVTQPQFVFMHEETERWIEITDKNGQLITVIEALSPSNKGADILQLQPLLDRCYRMGGYWNADHRNIPGPTLPEDEAAWTVAQVNAAGVGA